MKYVVILTAMILGSLALEASAATGSHTVRAHTTKKGVYVPRDRATNPDHTKLNNWSTKGNGNPYTGKPGTKDPHKAKAQ